MNINSPSENAQSNKQKATNFGCATFIILVISIGLFAYKGSPDIPSWAYWALLGILVVEVCIYIAAFAKYQNVYIKKHPSHFFSDRLLFSEAKRLSSMKAKEGDDIGKRIFFKLQEIEDRYYR